MKVVVWSRLLVSFLALSVSAAGLHGRANRPRNLSSASHRSDNEMAPVKRLSSEIESLRKALKIPGISAAVVKDQKLLWAQGFGFADLEAKEKATKDTPYVIASLTKPFAATLFLQLLEQNKISLDDPIKKYFPRDFESERVKLRHLLTHTAGVSSPDMKPGDKYAYSGSWFGYLGYAIEKASGDSFRDQLINQVLEPLNMTDTVPGLDLLDETPETNKVKNIGRYRSALSRLAKPYSLYGSDEDVLSPYPPNGINSAAGLISTVVDLSKFDIALDRHVLLKPETQQLAWTNARTNSGVEIPYGLGWFVQRAGDMKLVWHYGQWPVFSGLILKIPERNLTLILLANNTALCRPFEMADGDALKSPFALAFIRAFTNRDDHHKILKAPDWQLGDEGFQKEIERLAKNSDYKYEQELDAYRSMSKYLATRLTWKRKEIVLDPATLDVFVGRYQIDAKQSVVIKRNGSRLSIQYTNQPFVDLFPSSATDFFEKVADEQVSFIKDNNGSVTDLIFRSSGTEKKAKRIN
jgi:CubicO group peptidase (beta-lactamase class C family)